MSRERGWEREEGEGMRRRAEEETGEGASLVELAVEQVTTVGSSSAVSPPMQWSPAIFR